LFRRPQQGAGPEPESVTRAQPLAAWAVAVKMVRDNRADRLLEVHRRLEMPPPPISAQAATMIAWLEFRVLFLFRVLPDEVLESAGKRLAAINSSGALRETVPWDYLALALLRLRQRRYDEVERLCGEVQASAGATAAVRATAFAMACLARQEQGQPDEDVIAAAAIWDVDLADNVADIRRALVRDQVCADFDGYAPDRPGQNDPARTSRLLAAYRDADRVALHQAGLLARMLLDEGRIDELRELHGTFPMPPGPDAKQHVIALGNVSYVVLLDPGVPAEVVAEAGSRVSWILEAMTFEGPGVVHRAALRHTMALARLRQGRLSEVEALCAESLALPQIPAANRASVLATVVLARQALGEPCDALLTEAMMLAPHATLVAQARHG
jgi:hypothetical protein